MNRLRKHTEGVHGLSDEQFGFRKGRSAIEAIKKVIEVTDKARQQKIRGNRFCAVTTIDVRNAFNSASWMEIAKALHVMRVPDYLCRMLKSYFEC